MSLKGLNRSICWVLLAIGLLGLVGAVTAGPSDVQGALLGLITPVRGGAAGNAGDADATTYTFAADSSIRPLTRLNGAAIARNEAPSLYGSADGMTIYDNGVNVASGAYAGFAGPKTPVGMDLSDVAGWPNIAVPSGQVAIDPILGRSKFHTGGSPFKVSNCPPGNPPVTIANCDGIALRGHYAYLTSWTRDLDVFDITDPANPTWITQTLVNGNGMDILIDGNYAYLTMKSGGLRIFSLTNPERPQEVGSIKADPAQADLALHLAKVGDLVYVADEMFGVVIYNVSNPSHPTKVGVCPISFGEAVQVVGSYAYVTGGTVGFRIYDISDPAHPVLKGSLPTLAYTYDVQVLGQYAYLTEGRGGLRVVNISDPLHPSDVITAATTMEAYDIQIANGCAYISERRDKDTASPGYFQVFSLRDPAAPVLVSSYYSSKYRINGSCIVGPLAYTAGHNGGLLVINPNLSEAPQGPVTVDYNWDDPSLTATPTVVPTPTSTPDPSQTMTLTVGVALQGRGDPPSAGWETMLHVALTEPNGGLLRHTFSVTSDTQGRVMINGIPQGSYDVQVRCDTTLANVCRARSFSVGTHTLNLGLLLEGDANGDGAINILDFSLLASAYGEAEGSPSFDARGDFNEDGIINILDFSMLASNYGLAGPREVDCGN